MEIRVIVKSDSVDVICSGNSVAEACDIGAVKILKNKFPVEYCEFLESLEFYEKELIEKKSGEQSEEQLSEQLGEYENTLYEFCSWAGIDEPVFQKQGEKRSKSDKTQDSGLTRGTITITGCGENQDKAAATALHRLFQLLNSEDIAVARDATNCTDHPITTLEALAYSGVPVAPPVYNEVFRENKIAKGQFASIECVFNGYKVTGTAADSETARAASAKIMVQALKNGAFMKKVGENQAQMQYNNMVQSQNPIDMEMDVDMNRESQNISDVTVSGVSGVSIVSTVSDTVHTKAVSALMEHVKLLNLQPPAWIHREGVDYSGRKLFIAVCRIALDGGSPFASDCLSNAEGSSITGKNEAKMLASQKMMVVLEEKMGSTLEVERRKSSDDMVKIEENGKKHIFDNGNDYARDDFSGHAVGQEVIGDVDEHVTAKVAMTPGDFKQRKEESKAEGDAMS